jgi:hypothetical protein
VTGVRRCSSDLLVHRGHGATDSTARPELIRERENRPAEEFRDGDDWPHNALAAIKAE